MAVVVKLVTPTVPTGQIVFCRAFFAILPILVLVLWRGELHRMFATKRPFGHASRTLLGLSSMALGFLALALIPLPDATAIGYAMPLFATIFAALILKERVRVYRWSAVIVGLAGVLVILAPYLLGAPRGGGWREGLGASLALTGAVASALAMVSVRHLTRTEPNNVIVFWFAVGGATFSLLTLPLGLAVPEAAWVVPDARTAALLLTIGLLGGFAQILLTSSYRHADASVIAPFEYTSILFAVAFGWWLFGDAPSPTMGAGSAIVIGAGLFVIWREHRLGIERRERAVS
jgi:drug/metabolite transporter (DMT)-like permease